MVENAFLTDKRTNNSRIIKKSRASKRNGSTAFRTARCVTGFHPQIPVIPKEAAQAFNLTKESY